MKLLILTQKMDVNDDNLGFFHRWVEEFAKQCESVIVLCLFEGEHHLPKNVRVLSLGKEDGVSRFKYLKRFYTYIWRERKNYDAVFVHMNQIYVILGALLWRMLNKRVGFWYAHGKMGWTVIKAAILSHVVFTSTAEGFRLPLKRHIVGQGIDGSMFAVKESYEIGSEYRIVTAGRITGAKHIDEMIRIIAALCAKGIPTTLTVIGSGDSAQVEELKVQAKDAGAPVEFLGGMSYTNLAKTLRDYDVFLNLGTTGSLDKAILDAAAAGLPVVTPNAGLKDFSVNVNPANALQEIYRMKVEERKEIALNLYSWVIRTHPLSKLVEKIIIIQNS